MRRPGGPNFQSQSDSRNASKIDLLEQILKKDVYDVINAFTREVGADFPGASLAQTQTVLRKVMQ